MALPKKMTFNISLETPSSTLQDTNRFLESSLETTKKEFQKPSTTDAGKIRERLPRNLTTSVVTG